MSKGSSQANPSQSDLFGDTPRAPKSRKLDRGARASPPLQTLLELDAALLTGEQLDHMISWHAERLGHLKQQKKARLAGVASGVKRKAAMAPDEVILAVYDEVCAEMLAKGHPKKYGALRTSAGRLGLTEDYLGRRLRRLRASSS